MLVGPGESAEIGAFAAALAGDENPAPLCGVVVAQAASANANMVADATLPRNRTFIALLR